MLVFLLGVALGLLPAAALLRLYRQERTEANYSFARAVRWAQLVGEQP